MNRLSTISLLLLVGCFFSCEEPNYPKNIYDENPEVLPNPTITSISPSDSAFSGIGIITITGTKFSSTMGKNLVYFNGNVGTVQSATATELIVRTANIIADSVKIQVAVIGAYEFAEWDNYGLYSSVVPWGGFDPLGTSLWAIAVDDNENVYVSESNEREILRVGANGIADSLRFAEHSSKLKAIGMRYNSGDDFLYMAVKNRDIFSVDSSHNADDVIRMPNSIKAYDLDYDQDGNMYAGGRSNELYRVNLGAGETDFTLEASLPVDVHMNTIRVFDNHVYMLGENIGSDTTITANGIYRSPIVSSDSLGPTELLIDWDIVLGANATKPFDFTFTLDGSMIVGVDYIDPSSYESLGPGLYEVSPPYIDVLPVPIYEEVYKAPASKLTWGNDKYLYVNNRNTASPPEGASWDYKPIDQLGLYRIDMARLGAPYYGRSF